MTPALGSTPFERLRKRYETTRKRCSACGYIDESPAWACRTDGRRIVYRFVCSSCDAVHEHAYHRSEGR